MNKEAATTGGRGARQRIIDTAAQLFYLEGINATGVERLATEASVSKRTLYQHFPSKAAVVEQYLRGMEERMADTVVHSGEGLAPRGRMLAVFDRHTAPGGTFRGCPFHNAAVESAGTVPVVRDIVRTSKIGFADWLADLAEQAGAADPRSLGDQLALLYEGAAALATSLDNAEPWTRAAKVAEILIERALD